MVFKLNGDTPAMQFLTRTFVGGSYTSTRWRGFTLMRLLAGDYNYYMTTLPVLITLKCELLMNL